MCLAQSAHFWRAPGHVTLAYLSAACPCVFGSARKRPRGSWKKSKAVHCTTVYTVYTAGRASPSPVGLALASVALNEDSQLTTALRLLYSK